MKNTIKPVVVLAADHAGYEIKEFIKPLLDKMGYSFEDVGTHNKDSVDYPDYAEKMAIKVVNSENKVGILTCGTGIGAVIAANKIPGIRAALVNSEKDAVLSIEHNNANVLVLGGRPFDREKVQKIIPAWFQAEFHGGRHLRRVKKIEQIEKKYSLA